MPMPAANSPWPPKAWQPAYAQYEENDAWLTGDTTTLQKLYRGEQATHTRRGQPLRGGLVGAASRFMWGRPVPAGEHRTRVHLPLAADLATLASDLQYSDPPVTDFADGQEQVTELAQARLDDILNGDAHHAMLNSMGEIKSALGATVIIPRWDVELEDHVWLDYAAADTVVPVFRHGRLVEVTLWSEYSDGTHVYWRHLEHHATGYIEHALYRGTKTNLGTRVPLQERPETEPYAALIDGESRIPTQIDRLTAGYLPNAPALAWRKQAALKDAGRSDFNQLPPLFDNADETWSSWMRDLKLGAGRLIVPEAYLRSNGPGAGASFDLFQEMFVGLQVPGSVGDGMDLTPNQFQIRVQEHSDTLDKVMLQILHKAGFSPSAWGLGDRSGSQATATEIQQREHRTETSRSKKNLYDRMVLSRMGSVALELDGILFPGKGGGRYDLNVVFPDISRTDPKVEAETIGLLKVAEAISTETAVRRANPDWEDDAIAEEVARIQKVKDAQRPPDPFGIDRVDDEPEE
ncbi:phage portal protein [Leucobacter allii]|uniref:Phage portal protein n=1 Tax=Leucobacter allii TaxID=2932247 RepID=A0ABY4FP90_9MICO|nr:phage portal protein [Leucobacter allii]UOQ58106.1 phage portal protein [Leucobacter allii]